MTKDTVVAFRTPEGFSPDPLTDLLRQGARELIAQAVEAELNTFLAAHADQTDAAGRRRLVRHGHLPEREVQTGIGGGAVKVPRVRDRAPEGAPLRFTSTILPPQLMLSAKKKWRKRDGQNRLPEIIQGVEFRDGIKHEIKAA